jgi:pSer/pThr/pTyr-binding forkhead associated (FHA) protein
MPEFEKILGENKQSILIGSQRGAVDVLVTNEIVSKKHVKLELVGIKGELALSVIDTSTNGTFLNGKRLEAKKKRFRIRSGDTLQLMDPSIDEEYGWKVDFGNTVAFFSRN